MKKPWSKFYWSDWRGDPKLRMCTLAARGLWIEMLGLMHEAEPYGHLLVTGRPPTDAQLAVLAGAPPEQIPDLLGELESAGVFSRTQKGAIYSRRMTRDDKKARTARRIGRLGGNPTLSKQKAIPPSDNPTLKPPDKPQRLEARVDRDKISKTVDSVLTSLNGNSMRVAARNGPNYDDRATRKHRWQQKIEDHLRRTLPEANAAALIHAYAEGEPGAKRVYEDADKHLKQLRLRVG